METDTPTLPRYAHSTVLFENKVRESPVTGLSPLPSFLLLLPPPLSPLSLSLFLSPPSPPLLG